MGRYWSHSVTPIALSESTLCQNALAARRLSIFTFTERLCIEILMFCLYTVVYSMQIMY